MPESEFRKIMTMNFLNKAFLVSVCASLFVIGCDKYDDSNLSGRVDKLENRVDILEQTVDNLNTNITSVTKLVKALQEENRIERIEQIEGGYKIILADGKGELTILNSEKPAIGITIAEDGVFYWTIDGEFMLINGDKIPATMAPEFKVEDGCFWFRINNGEWSKVTGSDSGIGLIKDIIESNESVTFILSEGGEIVIPKVQAFRLNINIDEAGIMSGSTATIPYTITAGDANTKVAAIASSGYTASVNGNSKSGTITVTAPETVPSKADILVVAVNSNGVSSSKILTFEQGELKIAKDTYTIGAQGGVFQVELKTNLEWSTFIDPDPKNAWLTVVPTTKALRNEILTLSATENVDGKPRTAEVHINYGNTSQTITVTQLHTAIISGGSADLSSISQSVNARIIVASGTSTAGWTFENCLIFGPTQWDAIKTKTLALSGSTSKIGSLTSPSLEGGCGSLTIRYGGHVSSSNHKIKFRVDVMNASGKIIKTQTIGENDGSYEMKKVYESIIDVSYAGNFSMVLTNLCPSGGSLTAGPKDAVTLLSIAWTGYSE